MKGEVASGGLDIFGNFNGGTTSRMEALVINMSQAYSRAMNVYEEFIAMN